jgi:hypothetical protein
MPTAPRWPSALAVASYAELAVRVARLAGGLARACGPTTASDW